MNELKCKIKVFEPNNVEPDNDNFYDNKNKTEFALKNLKEIYQDHFLKLRHVVDIIEPIRGLRMAVEADKIDLGSDEESILNAIEELKKKYSPKDYYFCFYAPFYSKSEKLKKEFIEKYYKNGSRFPVEKIKTSDLEKCDFLSLKGKILSKKEFITRSTLSFNSSMAIDSIAFFSYNCDSLYKKCIEDLEASAKLSDTYYLQTIDPNQYYFKKIGYIKYNRLNGFESKKIEEEYGERFLSWLYNQELGIYNDIVLTVEEKTVNNKNIVTIRDNYKGPRYKVIKKIKDNEIKNLLIEKDFKDESEFMKFITSTSELEKIAFSPEDFIKLSDIYEIYDNHDFNMLKTDSQDINNKIQPKNNKNIENVFDQIRDIIKAHE